MKRCVPYSLKCFNSSELKSIIMNYIPAILHKYVLYNSELILVRIIQNNANNDVSMLLTNYV